METPATTSTTSPTSPIATTIMPSDIKDTTILSQEDGFAERSHSHTPFFEVEPTEAELMGEQTKEDEVKVDSKVEVKKEIKEEDNEKAKGETKEDVKKEESKDTKPPAGFVPHQALKEERAMRQKLQEELDALRSKVTTSSTPLNPSENETSKQILKSLNLPDDFKVLTEDEEDAMMEEDLFAYQKYQRNLRKYDRAVSEQASKQEVVKEITTRAEAIVEGALKRMETAIPGLHEPDSEINKNLTTFATTHGFDQDYLNAMTDPKTLILPAGAKNPIYLGDGAASLVEFIHNVFKSQDQTINRAQMEKEMMKKFKSPAINITHKSLGDAPGSMDIDKTTFGEKDFAKLSEEDQRRALGG
jgi:hypothetical protein